MIAIFLAPVYLLLHYYILLWLYSWTGSCFRGFHSLWFRIPVTTVCFFFSLSPLTGMLVTKKPFHHILKIISNYWLGTLQYILLIVLLFDAARRTVHIVIPNRLPGTLAVYGGIAVFLILAVSLYGILHAKQIRVHRYSVTVQKSCPVSKIKIALIADLHLGYNSTESHLRNLVEKINAQSPDLICIAGDFFDNEYDAIQNPDAAARILSELTCPFGVYGCWGNHDVSEKILAGFTFPHKEKLERDPRFEKLLLDAKITLLEDAAVCIDGAFYLAGRKDPDMAKKEHDTRLSVSELTGSLDPSLPLIVLDHQPKELDAAAKAGVDLLLSGHTHNGQTFPETALIRFFWENPCGILQKNSMTSVVTSGAGIWGPAMRVITDNEIVILDVTFQNP